MEGRFSKGSMWCHNGLMRVYFVQLHLSEREQPHKVLAPVLLHSSAWQSSLQSSYCDRQQRRHLFYDSEEI